MHTRGLWTVEGREVVVFAGKQMSAVAKLHVLPVWAPASESEAVVTQAATVTVAAVVLWSPDCKKTYR